MRSHLQGGQPHALRCTDFMMPQMSLKVPAPQLPPARPDPSRPWRLGPQIHFPLPSLCCGFP